MMKKLVYILFFAISFVSFGQQPFINSISPTHIEVGQTVTVTGSNLMGSRVFFGGVESPNVSGSENLLQAEVPAGATQGSILVLNNSLIAESSEQFYLSFGGTNINSYSEVSPSPNTGQPNANDICLCDIDGDELNDVIISHNASTSDNSDSEISVFRNQSTATTPNFSALTTINNDLNSNGLISHTCADLDNDGRPELIFVTNFASSARHILIYQNQSTPGSISLNPLSNPILRLPTIEGANRIPRQIRVADMDGDGKLDLVLGNGSDNTVHVFRNISSGTSNFAFDAVFEVASGDDTSGSLFLADLDGDGVKDILSAPFRDQSLQSTSRVYFLKNNSIAGNLSFSQDGSFNNGTARITNIASGDFNEDGLNDLAITSRDGGIVTVARNTSTIGSISFTVDESLTGLGSPFGLALGDLNGDGKSDLVIARSTGDLLVFENNSTLGDISFETQVVISTPTTAGNICIGDLNGDAKPDLAFTEDINQGVIGKLGARMNTNCMIPSISPSDLTFCTGDPFTVEATKGIGTYSWEVLSGDGSNPADTDSDATFTINSGTAATIRVTFTQNGCSESGTADFTLAGGTPPAAPTISGPTDAICSGDNTTLSVTGSFEQYEWTLPDGSLSNASEITITNASSSDAGNYTVRVQPSSLCFSDESSLFSLEVAEPPTLQILNNGADTFCDDGANNPTLEVNTIPGLSYQWQRDGVDISGATSATLEADQTGNYSVVVSDGNPCSNETAVYSLTEVTQPVPDIAGPATTCIGVTTTFSAAASTVQTGFTAVNSWEVRDASTTLIQSFTGDELVSTFTEAGTFEVTLTTSYDPSVVDACANTLPFNVTVSDVPEIVFNVAEDSEKCELDAISVSIDAPSATSIVSRSWSVKDAENMRELATFGDQATVEANTPVGVDSIFVIATITTDIGCQVKDSVKVKNFLSDVDISSMQFDLSNDTVTLEDANFVSLTAENLVSDIAWSPSSIINDTTARTVTVFPSSSPSLVTLSGIDQNGCGVTSTVTVILDNVRPRRTFSPNGDGQGFDCWEILNTSELQGCEVFIFDSRGKNILVKNSPFVDNCVWDGNFNGSPVPEGIYYFVLKCEGSNPSKSGSILLAR